MIITEATFFFIIIISCTLKMSQAKYKNKTCFSEGDQVKVFLYNKKPLTNKRDTNESRAVPRINLRLTLCRAEYHFSDFAQ